MLTCTRADCSRVQGEHADLLAVAVSAGELAALPVEDVAVGRVPVLDDLESLMHLAARVGRRQVVAQKDRLDRSPKLGVRRGLTDVGGIIAYENVKTARSFRSVPMADLALEKLAEHIEVFVRYADASALLFPGAKGAPLRPNNLRKRHCGPAVISRRARSPVAS